MQAGRGHARGDQAKASAWSSAARRRRTSVPATQPVIEQIVEAEFAQHLLIIQVSAHFLPFIRSSIAVSAQNRLVSAHILSGSVSIERIEIHKGDGCSTLACHARTRAARSGGSDIPPAGACHRRKSGHREAASQAASLRIQDRSRGGCARHKVLVTQGTGTPRAGRNDEFRSCAWTPTVPRSICSAHTAGYSARCARPCDIRAGFR